ncbi:hypothetical protein P7H74_14740 [Enterococcus devriesei]|uniref:hypothetical protein n=1 Tax=Enterococcus devriesei TaxID=319970 RepID=UPI00288F486B|nr:hypothetical protein [Enterococcus devriesei]MDT2823008.1 hypothetical protein [Enterococcus devriesei]
MNKVLSFLSSSLFSNILAILGLIAALLPQKDTISIDNSRNYYFQSTNSKSRISDNTEIVLGVVGLLFTYIMYAFLQPYFPTILLALSVGVIIKYRWLRIAYKKQMVIPALLVVVAISLNYLSPKEILDYWNQAYKMDLNRVGTLSQVLTQLITPFIELKDLLLTIKTNPFSVAVLANMFFAYFATFYMIDDLIKPKRKIKVMKRSTVIVLLVFFSVIISFMFYTDSKSHARIIVERVTYFLSN